MRVVAQVLVVDDKDPQRPVVAVGFASALMSTLPGLAPVQACRQIARLAASQAWEQAVQQLEPKDRPRIHRPGRGPPGPLLDRGPGWDGGRPV